MRKIMCKHLRKSCNYQLIISFFVICFIIFLIAPACHLDAQVTHYQASLLDSVSIPFSYQDYYLAGDILLQFYNIETTQNALSIYAFTINGQGVVSPYNLIYTVADISDFSLQIGVNCVFYRNTGKTVVGLKLANALRFIQLEGETCLSDRTIPNLSNPHLYSSVYWNSDLMLFTNENHLQRLYFQTGQVDTLYTSPGNYGCGVIALARDYLVIQPSYPNDVDNYWLLYDYNLNYLSNMEVTNNFLLTSMIFMGDGVKVGQGYVLHGGDGVFGVRAAYITVINNQLGWGDSFGYTDGEYVMFDKVKAYADDKFAFIGPWSGLSFYSITGNTLSPLNNVINIGAGFRDYNIYDQSLITLSGMTDTKLISFLNRDLQITDQYTFTIPEQGNNHYTDSNVLNNCICFINDHSNIWFFRIIEYTSIDEQDTTPVTNINLNAFPNPFKSSMDISFDIKERSDVHIGIYNLKGQTVRDLYHHDNQSGKHQVLWDGKDNQGLAVESGIYFIKVRTSRQAQVEKAVRLR